MDHRIKIQRSIEFIELNIKGEISPDALADMAGFSQKHYYRLFKKYVGISVMDYIRQRKLAHAIFDIMTGSHILDAALDYGFESHGGFTKAFKKQYGLPPQKYMIYATAVQPQPVNLFSQAEKYGTKGAIMEPRIVHKSAFKIAGYGISTNRVKSTRDCPALWDKVNIDGLAEQLYTQLRPKKHTEYGVCYENDTETGAFIYILGVEVESFDNITSEMVSADIPAADYAVFTTPPTDDAGFSTVIRNTWQYIICEWFPHSGYLMDETKVDFELYDERCHEPTHQVMEIYIPVTKKQK